MLTTRHLSHHSARASFRLARSFSSSNTSNITSIRLYRIMLRLTNNLEGAFPLQQPLNPRDYGQARLFTMPTSSDKTLDIYKLFVNWHDDNPDLSTWYCSVSEMPYTDDEDEEEECTSLWASKAELKTAIRRAFRKAPKQEEFTVPMQRLAMDAILNIQEQARMQQRSSVSIDAERGVRVVATSRCVIT